MFYAYLRIDGVESEMDMSSDNPIHPLIALFEHKAQVMDSSGVIKSQDDAIAMLAQWMALREGQLTEDDWIILSDVGAILYQDGLRRRTQ